MRDIEMSGPEVFRTGAGGPAPAYQILQTETNAYIFITVYPSSFNLQASDYTQLGQQILVRPRLASPTLLTSAAELHGQLPAQCLPAIRARDAGSLVPVRSPPSRLAPLSLRSYGFQPAQYLPMWRTMYQSIKAIVPQVAIIWAPNTGQSCATSTSMSVRAEPRADPYGQTTNNPADLRLLDTNGDGQVTAADDAFSPYYPGDEYVDWIGLSVYYKGPNVRCR